MRLVAIHQPNFFPWLGYFDKMNRADVFVLLDNVQFQKTGGTWSNRVMLNIGASPRWVTAPVVRAFHGVRAINEVAFDETKPWRERFLRTLQTEYRRAPCFEEAFEILRPLILNNVTEVSRYNIQAISEISRHLRIDSHRFVLASSLNASGQATDLLVELVNRVGGTHYLVGGGATGYQQDESFARAGINIVHQSYVHPVYSQIGNEKFVAGLSVIDALMNCGTEGTVSLLRQAN